VEFLESERREGVLIVRFLNSRLVAEDVVSGVGRELLEQAGEAAAYGGKLVLSFKGVVSVSSHMLGRLVILHKRCRDLGVELKLCEMSPDVYDVFRGFGPAA
jgi:anti-anti-sigma regulatory factor